MDYIDLHVHSTASDGSLKPAQVVELALEKELRAIALTDHDTVDGLKEALACSRGRAIEVIPGIELSAEYKGRDIHILGFYLSYDNPEFIKKLEEFRDTRDRRNEEMAAALKKEGMDISLREMKETFGRDTVLTRAHFARMMAEKGYVKNYDRAFTLYIGDGCKCYIPRKKAAPAEAIRLIRNAGGVPVLAHPLLYHLDGRQLDELVGMLSRLGLKGLEAIYTTHSQPDESRMKRLASKYQLIITGGSDFHGAAKPDIQLGTGRGGLRVPETLLKPLRELA